MNLWSTLTRGGAASGSRVIVHILDPIKGASTREVTVGRDVDADTVHRFAEAGALHVVVDYTGGVPSSTVCTRAQWLRMRERQEAAVQEVDPRVWRRRDELDIRVG
jgi:hypothetical protein